MIANNVHCGDTACSFGACFLQHMTKRECDYGSEWKSQPQVFEAKIIKAYGNS